MERITGGKILFPAPKTAGSGIDYRHIPIHPALLPVLEAQKGRRARAA